MTLLVGAVLAITVPAAAATGSVSNLSLSASEGTVITAGYPSGQGFTTGSGGGTRSKTSP